MSEQGVEPNGDTQPSGVDNVALAARLDLCLKRLGELGHALMVIRSDVNQVRVIAENVRHAQKDIVKGLRDVASDQLELRTGIPPTWRQRAALVAIAAVIGACAGSAATHIGTAPLSSAR